jgi:uncharacterized membrane protein YbhN (UPF0104 family)
MRDTWLVGRIGDRTVEEHDSADALERARFTPLRLATRPQRALVLLLGPLLWVAALVVLAVVVRQGDSVLIALAVLAAAMLIGLVVLLPMRIGRVRRERER